jgi:hypothetical protein
MATHLIDFSIQPNESRSLTALRRYDLATLRQCARNPLGVPDGELIGKDSRDRLVQAHMVIRTKDGMNLATYYGRQTVRYNSSTIDGSEGYPSREHLYDGDDQ